MRTPRLVGPWLLLAGGVAAAVAAVVFGQLRAGGYLLAGTLLVAALLRALLPARLVGAVAVRSRLFDVLLLLAAAAAAAVLARTLLLTL